MTSIGRVLSPEALRTHPLRDLIALLQHTGPLVQQTVALPGTDATVDVIRPCDLDGLLDQSEGDPEDQLPYWSEIWPSGVALAAELIRHPELVADTPVLELGSGVGITAAVALQMGARLVATDYAPESLVMTRITSRLLTGREPEIRQVNWRDPLANIFQADGTRWPVILAADVLYEQRDVEPILDVFERVLQPGGWILLADQDRPPANRALKMATERGWEITTTSSKGGWTDTNDAGVVVRIHHLTQPRRR